MESPHRSEDCPWLGEHKAEPEAERLFPPIGSSDWLDSPFSFLPTVPENPFTARFVITEDLFTR
jgi:hypothetical protein